MMKNECASINDIISVIYLPSFYLIRTTNANPISSPINHASAFLIIPPYSSSSSSEIVYVILIVMSAVLITGSSRLLIVVNAKNG